MKLKQLGDCLLTSIRDIKLIPIPWNQLSSYDMRSLMNSSIQLFNGKLVIASRLTNYNLHESITSKYLNQVGYVGSNISNIHSDINICELDPVKNYIIQKTTIKFDKSDLPFSGLEDPRLIAYGGKLFMTGTMYHKDEKDQLYASIHQIELDNQYEIVKNLELTRFQQIEKNWMPIESMYDEFVYSLTPYKIASRKCGEENTYYVRNYHCIPFNKDIQLSGGSQVRVIDKDHYLAVVHSKEVLNRTKGLIDYQYKHYFVLFDKDLNVRQISEPFSILDGKVEFCSGIEEYDDMIYLTVSSADSVGYVMRFPLNEILDD